MGPADALSRKDEVNTTDDNHMVTMLSENNVCHKHVRQLDLALMQKITKSSAIDPIVTKALAAMNDKNIDPWLPQTTKEDWKFENRHLYFKNQIYIPEEA